MNSLPEGFRPLKQPQGSKRPLVVGFWITWMVVVMLALVAFGAPDWIFPQFLSDQDSLGGRCGGVVGEIHIAPHARNVMQDAPGPEPSQPQ